MLLQISNEAIVGVSLIAVIVIILFCAITYLITRRSVNALKTGVSTIPTQLQQLAVDLNNLKPSIQQTTIDINQLKLALPRYEEVNELKRILNEKDEQQKAFVDSVTSTLDGYKRANAQEIDSIRVDIIEIAQDRSLKAARNHIESNSVTREEFNELKDKFQTVMASEEFTERLELLGSLFDSDNIRTLVWQCKLIRLTHNGLAPDAEEETLIREGIPLTAAKNFLDRLTGKGIVDSKKVESYYLVSEFTWLTSFVEDPNALQNKLRNYIKKEGEYQKHVRENVSLIEDGLIIIAEQYEVDSGRIDILCRDGNGYDVALELKYPAANNGVVGQILRYREDQKRKTGNGHTRFVLVSPKIPSKLKDLLSDNMIEHKEIPF
jgi:hypothetical protein